MSRYLLFVVPLALSSASTAAPRDNLNAAARDFVRLELAIGEKEDGYIDAYYGPADLKAEGQALAKTSDLPALQDRAQDLRSRIAKLAAENPRRSRFLQAQLTAAVTRLRMMRGEKLSFDDEALGLFGLRPKLKPLSAYDPILARIDKLIPGKGTLAERVDAFQDGFLIKTERLKPVFDAAIAGCKARTVRHIKLPPKERFDLAFVTGKSWSGYNYYQGKYHSKIEVNTDLPIRISRAVDLGCHEGYPGHHVLNSLLEQRLERGRGWAEFSVYPLFSPQSVIAEGSANYGIDLAFPGPQKLAFETSTLYPRAGLPTRDAARYDALLRAMKDLAGSRMTIARAFLDGRISEAQAVELQRKYGLTSEARAKQSISFTKQYRTYVINYGLGEQMVKLDVESRRGTAARWKRFEQIISEPTLPSDLKSR
ncbi:hypothetical protein GCM10022276_21450 [Sphingomonas limnosediminicola]|uniref:DUF885 domain-containing protein n=1 Tax=Sphingomonas limnosediminicola TaxID=940133 RepID=A0ABP7LKH3_9SPHN